MDTTTLILGTLTLVSASLMVEAWFDRRSARRALASRRSGIDTTTDGVLGPASFERSLVVEWRRSDRLGVPVVMVVAGLRTGEPLRFTEAISSELEYPWTVYQPTPNLVAIIGPGHERSRVRALKRVIDDASAFGDVIATGAYSSEVRSPAELVSLAARRLGQKRHVPETTSGGPT